MAIYSDGNKTIVVNYSEWEADSPRDWDNFGTMLTWERWYLSPDKNPYSSPEDFVREMFVEVLEEGTLKVDDVRNVLDVDEYDSFDELAEALSDRRDSLGLLKDRMVLLPVYRYEHSAVAYNTEGFADGWDSGQTEDNTGGVS